MFRVFLVTFAVALSLTAAGPVGKYKLPESTCPTSIQYVNVDDDGKLEANLIIGSPHKLKGVWLRVIFDRQVDDLTASDNFVVERKPDHTKFDYLIKNPNTILEGAYKALPITIRFSGPEVPKIIEYRLNAYTLCPPSDSSPYPNDETVPSNYLQSLVRDVQDVAITDCGVPGNTDGHAWQAAIFSQINGTEQYSCEATAISSKHLLTAAHCVTNLGTAKPVGESFLKIYVGRYDLANANAPAYEAKRIVVYPGYNPTNLLNDIAVIEVNEGGAPLSPVCLPIGPLPSDAEQDLSGYQIESNHFTKASSVKIRRVDEEHCVKSTLKTFFGDGSFCASYNTDNTLCVGDSGSASIALQNNHWAIQGILNVGTSLQGQQQCNDSSRLIFTDVLKYTKWIKSSLAAA